MDNLPFHEQTNVADSPLKMLQDKEQGRGVSRGQTPREESAQLMTLPLHPRQARLTISTEDRDRTYQTPSEGTQGKSCRWSSLERGENT